MANAVPPLDDNLDELLNAVHEAGMPGVFAEVRAQRRRELAAGFADVETMRPVQPWLQHRVGSITKSLVATVVLQLVGERRLRLDDLVSRHLPQLNTGRVTVRMLLNHTSGIGNYTNELFKSAEDLISVGTRTFTPIELARLGLSMPPTADPGAAWSYTNTGYLLLGMIVERLTGRRYATEIQRRILLPLGLWRSYFPGTDPHIRGPHSKAYVPWLDGTLRDFSVYNMSWAWAAGELVSTPQDLNRFYRALLAGRLLRRDLLDEMRTTVPMDPAAPEDGGYGLGLYWVGLPNGPAWGHDGGVIGQATLSLHSSASVSFAQNMTFYAAGPNPIDDAVAAFLLAALGNTATAEAKTGTPTLWRDRITSLEALPLRRVT
jgi:D-alanyl-D-alanine carboxypeptidase